MPDGLNLHARKAGNVFRASQVLRHSYDLKCKLLGRQESRGESVDKTRAVIKDLHSRIRVSIKRMESISMKIKKIRDDELQPQLEELAKGYVTNSSYLTAYLPGKVWTVWPH
ncbi:hypothetical protein QQ045_027690 [Rhodiola kirilowii]